MRTASAKISLDHHGGVGPLLPEADLSCSGGVGLLSETNSFRSGDLGLISEADVPRSVSEGLPSEADVLCSGSTEIPFAGLRARRVVDLVAQVTARRALKTSTARPNAKEARPLHSGSGHTDQDC